MKFYFLRENTFKKMSVVQVVVSFPGLNVFDMNKLMIQVVFSLKVFQNKNGFKTCVENVGRLMIEKKAHKKMKIVIFLIRLLVGIISCGNLITGCCLLLYVFWCLNPTNISNFQSFAKSDRLLTTSQIVLGLIVSVKGLIGIYATWRRHQSLLKLLLFMTILVISLEVGAFISVKNANIKLDDLVGQVWKEINGHCRNYIQKNLKCCGLTGLSEFASKLDPIDSSCYVTRSNNDYDNNINGSLDANNNDINNEPYRVGCKWKLIDWIERQTKTFIISTCLLIGLQLISVILILILLKLIRNKVLKQQRQQLEETSSIVFNNHNGKEILLEDLIAIKQQPSQPSTLSSTLEK